MIHFNITLEYINIDKKRRNMEHYNYTKLIDILIKG